MASFTILVLFLSLSSPLLANATDTNLPDCMYPSIYNFGDSNSDTGGIAAAFSPPGSPFGQTYFHRPAGRASDGRLIIDFIADHLGLQYLSPYLDPVGADYQNGVNFATGGATVMRSDESWFKNRVSPFSLEIQVKQFTQFQDRAAFIYNNSTGGCLKSKLPNPEDCSKALFTIDIGQNDVASGIRDMSFEQQQAAISTIISQFVYQVRVLYLRGAKTFWIHNTGPIGCLPIAIVKVNNPVPGYLDADGCVKSQNDIAMEFNKQMKVEIDKLRSDFSDATIIYVDMYSAKHELITNANEQGFEDPFKICCGYHGMDYDIWCGNTATLNGTEVFAGSCQDPSKVVSWDGVHYTEAANQWIANKIINGWFSDPPVPITRACLKQNFGDSNSDTGGRVAAFSPPGSRFGQTYFHRPAGRASDGRLIIDFIADHLGLRHLSPYLDLLETNGVNLQVGRPLCGQMNLEIQVKQFTQFQDRAAFIYDKLISSLQNHIPMQYLYKNEQIP